MNHVIMYHEWGNVVGWIAVVAAILFALLIWWMIGFAVKNAGRRARAARPYKY
jgi:hypothetical protein